LPFIPRVLYRCPTVCVIVPEWEGALPEWDCGAPLHSALRVWVSPSGGYRVELSQEGWRAWTLLNLGYSIIILSNKNVFP
jgi:hypothetical protein